MLKHGEQWSSREGVASAGNHLSQAGLRGARLCGLERTWEHNFQINTCIGALCSLQKVKVVLTGNSLAALVHRNPAAVQICGKRQVASVDKGCPSQRISCSAWKRPRVNEIHRNTFLFWHLSHTRAARNLRTHLQWIFWMQTDSEISKLSHEGPTADWGGRAARPRTWRGLPTLNLLSISWYLAALFRLPEPQPQLPHVLVMFHMTMNLTILWSSAPGPTCSHLCHEWNLTGRGWFWLSIKF